MPEGGAARTVVISGGSRGLGEGLVRHYLGRGDQVATFSRAPSPFVEACARDYAARFRWRAVDAADASATADYLRWVESELGPVDLLINNAAVAVDGVLALQTPDDIHVQVAVNLEAVLLLTRGCVRSMLRGGGGVIVNVSSVVARTGTSGLSVYSATKGALEALTRSLARELGGKGIRVNSVAPGYVATEMSGGLGEAERAQIVRRTPLGRLGNVDDVVRAVDFVASPSAAFITGQTLVVDGGLTC